MTNKCDNKNPLLRSGVNQYERVLKALLPEHVLLDERNDADLILFVKNYARQLKYFNFENNEDGTWEEMMSMDVSVTLATLAKVDVPDLLVAIKDVFDFLKTTPVSDEVALKKNFKVLFDLGFTLTSHLNQFYNNLPHDFAFRDVIKNSIQSDLAEYYARLQKYFLLAVSDGVIDATSIYKPEVFPFEILLCQEFNEGTLDQMWFDASLPTFSPVYNGANTALKIKNISTHNLFTGIFDHYLKTLSRLVEQASLHLDKTLSNFPTHSPHYGLMLVFIKLFRYAQEEGNKFTKRHLDLYYKEILKLQIKGAVPDKAHVVLELTKGVNQHLLKEGTVFKGGKDLDGQEIYYSLTDDIVINKGVVKSIKSTYVDKVENELTLFANPVANSEDGLGGKLLSTDKSWKVFGDAGRQKAQVGFVVASSVLFLNSGTRNITFTFFSAPGSIIDFTAQYIAASFQLQLSGKKGWVDTTIVADKVTIGPGKEYFSITVTLDGGAPAIVPYSTKLHKYNFETSLPVAKFELNTASAKETLWSFTLQKVSIDVKVEGLKDVAIQNDTGNLSPSKPFDLFGSTTHIGSSFIIGCKEIFLKAISPATGVKVDINITWDNYHDLLSKITSEDTHKVSISYLEDSQWKSAKTSIKLFQDTAADIDYLNPGGVFAFQSLPLMSATGISSADDSMYDISSVYGPPIYSFQFIKNTSRLSFSLPVVDFSLDYTGNEHYSVGSTSGFIKIQLNTDLGHSTYAQKLAAEAKKAVITSVTEGSETTTSIAIKDVPEPYTPKVKEISLDYAASATIDFSTSSIGSVIHLTPIGSKDLISVAEKVLLPDVSNEGEIFIGIENFETDQRLSLLFQVAEGTADPLAEKQEMVWSFLAENNEWIEFRKEDVLDNTNDLTQSGIIQFSVSDKAVNESTIMPSGLHWIKGSVVEKTAAVCKLIEVVAQAAVVQYADYKNNGNHYKAVLPAMTISKLLISDSAIKKVMQPFASFHGRTKEDDSHFYTRASERLRHKNRAITVWDYERMVLEAYPEIYKVKCINHAHVVEKNQGGKTIYIDNELKPGYVLVVPIPDLRNKNAYDPLRPYTDLGLMTRVKKYLCAYNSPHVRLDVRNPKFEEIQLDLKIQYVTEDNEFYTSELRSEIEQFLAPWAFNPELDIEFGGKISKSVLIDFIEERPYVDHLSCVKMYCIVNGERSGDVEEAVATSARSVLVSVKSNADVNAHKISFMNDKCNC